MQGIANSNGVEKSSFSSPSNHFTIQFFKLEHVKFSAEEALHSIDNISYIKYNVVFLNHAKKKIAETFYYDVYGWDKNAQPSSLSQIFKAFQWSPNKSVVFVPEGEWASAPSSPSSTAINLNSKYSWKQSNIMMDIQFWSNNTTAIGEVWSDCDYNVAKFDVKSGKIQILRKNIHVYGYKVLNVNENAFVTKSILNNCASDEDEKHYYPYCEVWNRSTLYSEDITCPSKDK